MKHIIQKHKNGCAIAALSMLTGVGYNRVFKIVNPKRKTREEYDGTSAHQVYAALLDLNVKHNITYGKRELLSIKNNAFICVRIKGGGYHAVAWNAKNKRIFDPNPTKIKYMTKKYISENTNIIVEILE